MSVRASTAAVHAGVVVGAALVLGVRAEAQQVIHVVTGNFDEDRFGTAIAAVGDIDHDGRPDFAIGAIRDDDNGLDCGTIRIVSGRTGLEIRTLVGNTLEHMGASIAGVGDIDGDGTPDVLGGGPDFNFDIGIARLYSGATGNALYTQNGVAPAGGDRVGEAMSPAGDMNLDGYPDFAVGSAGESSIGGTNSGRVRVISGKDFTTMRTLAVPKSNAKFGAAIATLGDLIGDGYPEILVGAPSEDFAGRAHVYAGQDGAILFNYTGLAGFDQYGASVAAVGDTNGDGIVDLLVGAPGNDAGGTDAGAAYLIRGIFSNVLHTWTGAAGDALGTTVSGGFDLDGDGRPDVLVGAPKNDAAGNNSGAGYVFSGAPAANGATLYTTLGGAIGDAFGKSCAFVGDGNGDGIVEFAFGAPDSDPNGNLSGSAVVFTRNCGSTSSLGVGCPTGAATIPSLALSGCFVPTGIVSLEITQGVANGVALLFLGLTPASLGLPGGCILNFAPLPSPIALPLDGVGSIALSVPLPPGGPLVSFYAQALMADASAPHGFAATEGVHVSVP